MRIACARLSASLVLASAAACSRAPLKPAVAVPPGPTPVERLTTADAQVRADGRHDLYVYSFLRSDRNRCLILSKEGDKFLGTRVDGTIPRELRGGQNEVKYKEIISYSGATI